MFQVLYQGIIIFLPPIQRLKTEEACNIVGVALGRVVEKAGLRELKRVSVGVSQSSSELEHTSSAERNL
jgi:hypothetical protein